MTTETSDSFKNRDIKADWEEHDQVNFVKKVYSILAVQMAITSGFIFCAQVGAPTNMTYNDKG